MTIDIKPRLKSVVVPETVTRKANRADELRELPNYLRIFAENAEAISLFSMSETQPGPDKANTPWIKVLPDGTPDGVWVFTDGNWVKLGVDEPEYFQEMTTVYLSADSSNTSTCPFDTVEFGVGYVTRSPWSYNISEAGRYLIIAKASFKNLTTGIAGIYLQRRIAAESSFETIARITTRPITSTASVLLVKCYNFAADDYFNVLGQHGFGEQWVGGQHETYMSVMRVG